MSDVKAGLRRCLLLSFCLVVGLSFGGSADAAVWDLGTHKDATGVAVGPDGVIYIVESSNHRVVAMGLDGVSRPFAGIGISGNGATGGQATMTALNGPRSVAIDRQGVVYIADTSNYRVISVGQDGVTRPVAGNGVRGATDLSSQRVLATTARLMSPSGVAVSPQGVVYVADDVGNTVISVERDGVARLFAGTGNGHNYATGMPALETSLCSPYGLAVGADGAVYIANLTHQIVAIGRDRLSRALAGYGTKGQQDLTSLISVNFPHGVAVDGMGTVYIADRGKHRITAIQPNGTARLVAGTGAAGRGLIGDPASKTALNSPEGVAVDADGSIYVADTGNDRLLLVLDDNADREVAETFKAAKALRSHHLFSTDTDRQVAYERHITALRRVVDGQTAPATLPIKLALPTRYPNELIHLISEYTPPSRSLQQAAQSALNALARLPFAPPLKPRKDCVIQ